LAKPSQKEACRLFYMVKGHLPNDMKTIYACYDGYFKRLWNNTESYTHEVGFEEEYKKMLDKQYK
jgi:hypothetical protein